MSWKPGRRLVLVREAEAEGGIAELYAEMTSALGVPYVDNLHQAYGACPKFLAMNWETVSKVAGSKGLRDCAQRLREDAYAKAKAALVVPTLCSESEELPVSAATKKEMLHCVETFECATARWLMLAAFQRKAFDGPAGNAGKSPDAAEGQSCGHLPIVVLDEAMSPEVKATLKEIEKATGDPAMELAYCAIARWPNLLSAFWSKLKTEIGSAEYVECAKAIHEKANGLCEELPGPVELTNQQMLTAINSSQVESILHITEEYIRVMSGMLVNLAWVRIGLEGGNASPVEGAEEHSVAIGHETENPQAAA